MSDPQRNDFVQMSALLTGFAASTLAPQVDPVNLATTLLDVAQQRAGQAFTDLLSQYVQLSGGEPVAQMTPEQRQSIGEKLLGLSGGKSDGSPTALTAQAVLKAWYLGSWYQPFDSGKFAAGEQTVISDQAYVHGLAWQSMQSKAMGYSTWTFGYWASPPPPLADFTGQPDDPDDTAPGGGGSQA